jgi:putative transposase
VSSAPSHRQTREFSLASPAAACEISYASARRPALSRAAARAHAGAMIAHSTSDPDRRHGGTYFFSVRSGDGEWPFRNPRHVAALCEALRAVRACDPFETLALAVMPDHLHCIWRLPVDDANFSIRWEWVRKRTARLLDGCASRAAAWRPRLWEHLIRDRAELARHIDYIHFNPVKHGLARSAGDWRYSTFRQHVAAGRYRSDWVPATDSPVAAHVARVRPRRSVPYEPYFTEHPYGFEVGTLTGFPAESSVRAWRTYWVAPLRSSWSVLGTESMPPM